MQVNGTKQKGNIGGVCDSKKKNEENEKTKKGRKEEGFFIFPHTQHFPF